MATRIIKQSGGDHATLEAAMAVSSATDILSIQGTWSADDTTQVNYNVAAVVIADSDSKQIGRPFQSGDTHYRHRVTSGHAFVVTAEVDITGIDIQSDSTGVSDELFRAAGAVGGVVTNCMLGFTGNTNQQDVWYTEDSSTKTISFVQDFFYDVGRSIYDSFNGAENGTVTLNFNSCGSFNIGANSARNNGCWVGINTNNAGDTYNVNAHNCLMSVNDNNCFATNNATPTFNVDCSFSITSIATTAISLNEDTEDLTGTVGSYTWTTTPITGDEVGLINITSGTYNPGLVDDADNDAQEFHATATDAGLTIPLVDILGQTRATGSPPTNFFDVGPSALTLEAAPTGVTTRMLLMGVGV